MTNESAAPDMNEVRSALLRKRALLQAELRALSESAQSRLGHSGHPGYEPSDWIDIARDHIEGGVAASVCQRLHEGLADVEATLERLDANSYTRCEECGGEIEPARLEALPSARRCLPCQARVEGRRR